MNMMVYLQYLSIAMILWSLIGALTVKTLIPKRIHRMSVLRYFMNIMVAPIFLVIFVGIKIATWL